MLVFLFFAGVLQRQIIFSHCLDQKYNNDLKSILSLLLIHEIARNRSLPQGGPLRVHYRPLPSPELQTLHAADAAAHQTPQMRAHILHGMHSAQGYKKMSALLAEDRGQTERSVS